MAGVGGEQLEHAGVVGDLAGQGPADGLGQVVVADGDRVSVAGGALADLGRGPGADAGQGAQPAVGLGRVEVQGLLQAAGDVGGGDDGPGAYSLNAGPVPVPGRDTRPDPRGRDDPHPLRGRAGRHGAELAQQDPPGTVGFDAYDLLLQDRGDQRLEQPIGPADPQPPIAQGQLADDRMVRGESGQVVVRAELGGESVQQPGGTRAPGVAGDERTRTCGARHDTNGAGAVGGQRGAPDGARLVDAVGGI